MTLGVVAAMLVVVGSLTVLANALDHMRADREREIVTADRLDGVVERLNEFVILHKRLPCPANGDDLTGLESRVDNKCGDQANGVVPWRSLALSESSARDRWGRAFSYRVAVSLIRDNALTGEPSRDESFDVCRDQDCADKMHDARDGTGAGYVIVAHGKHAPGSFLATSGRRLDGQSEGAERANLSAHGPFVGQQSGSGGLDDVVRATSVADLFSLVAPGT
jgi:hypothetical protein